MHEFTWILSALFELIREIRGKEMEVVRSISS
jgi:hypothetical protein